MNDDPAAKQHSAASLVPSPIPLTHSETETPATRRGPRPGVALCLSGGGYRAMLFHLGALCRLNETGYLRKLDRVSSVSGGSITAGVLGLHWNQLQFDEDEVATNFKPLVIDPIRSVATKTIDIPSILLGLFLPGGAAAQIVNHYRKYLFGHATLQDLPNDPPRFVINATNVATGALWRFSKPFMADYNVGEIRNPKTDLAIAVGASSAFPPVLSPVVLHLKDSDYVSNSGKGLQHPPYTTNPVLSDGGVYDNLGLETAWKNYTTILVSDGGGKMSPQGRPWRDWLFHLYRVLNVINNQVLSLRIRQVVDSFVDGQRDGAYWGISTNIANYQLPDALPCPFEKTTKLANTPTRLKCLPSVTQERLINWGYAVCDAAIRKHVDPSLPAPSGFFYPDAGIG